MASALAVSVLKVRPVVFFNHLFPDALDELKKTPNNAGITVRKLLEKHSAVRQCKNVLKGNPDVDREGKWIPGKTLCWICGDVINADPACEHVLPILQALLLWNLWHKTEMKGEEDAPDYLKVEYGYAHRTPCNSVKGAIVFLKEGSRGGVEVDEEELRSFVNKIKEALKKDDKWALGRFAILKKRYDTFATKINEAPGIALLAGIARLKNPENYPKEFVDIIFQNEATVPAPPTYQEVRASITTAFNHISEKILGEKYKNLLPSYRTQDFVEANGFFPYSSVLEKLGHAEAVQFAANHIVLAVLYIMSKENSGGKSDRALVNILNKNYGELKAKFKDKYANKLRENTYMRQVILDSYFTTREAGGLLGLLAFMEKNASSGGNRQTRRNTKTRASRRTFPGRKTRSQRRTR